MKSSKLMLSVIALTGALGFSAVSQGTETVLSKDVFTDSSYCHAKFEAFAKTLWRRLNRPSRRWMT